MARSVGNIGGGTDGAAELRAAWQGVRGLLAAAALFSVFVNLLMLTGPLYMLNVYDRVLGSRSVETLVALSALVAFLYACMGVLDLVRGRVVARAGARLQAGLDRRVFAASLEARGRAGAAAGPQDLEAVPRAMASPAFLALFDLPFAPVFLGGLFLFHPWLGWLGGAGGLVLVALALANQGATRRALGAAARAGREADALGAEMRAEAETIRAMGLGGAAFARWQARRGRALEAAMAAADGGGAFGALIRALRLFLQSALLGLGAFLVLRGELTAGAMIAGSILLGRALAPVEAIVGGWAALARGREGWQGLAALLGAAPAEARRTALPRPRGRLDVEQATVVPPGEGAATLRMVSFAVEPGQAVGVIGASGAGKSTLARALTGAWPLAGGRIRLDGAALDQYDPDVLGRHMGYLPQRVAVFEGTVRDNIARLAPEPDDAAVVRAARMAAAHEMILRLPEGYDTRLVAGGGRLSGGQVQRIGLARALYGDPVLVVLDEPNSNLDHDGSEALNAAIRALKARGAAVLVMAHRPAAITECDLLLMLENGTRRAFGPKAEVLRGEVLNHRQIEPAPARPGLAPPGPGQPGPLLAGPPQPGATQPGPPQPSPAQGPAGGAA